MPTSPLLPHSVRKPYGWWCLAVPMSATHGERSGIKTAAASMVAAFLLVCGTRADAATPTLFVNNFNTTSNTSQILRFDVTTGASLGNFLVNYDGSYISSFVFGPDRNLYVGRFIEARIDRYDGATGMFIDTFATVSGITNLAFGPDGNLYVARGSNPVVTFDGATGANLGTFLTPPSGLSVEGLTFRGDSLYVGYNGFLNGAFYRYDAASGGNPLLISGSLYANGPRVPSFDDSGTIYLPVWQTNQIFKFDEATLALTGTITTASGFRSNSLAFDESGALIALSDDGTESQINRYNPSTGAFIDTLVAPGTGGLGRASNMILVVPEPSACGLGAAGLAFVAMGALRRRRRQQRLARIVRFRSHSNPRFSWFISLAACLIAVSAGAIVRAEAVNLLSNSGGETGSTAPWEVGSIFGATVTTAVTSGTISAAGQTLTATQGAYWFSADGIASSINAGFAGYLRTIQRVDVRGMGAEAVQFQGDGFAAGEIMSGEGTIFVSHDITLIFLDESYGFLGSHYSWSGMQDATNTKVMFAGTPTVAVVPEGTALIDFYTQVNLQPYSGTGLTYRLVAGLDNSSLQVASVPEPSTIALALAGLAVSVWGVPGVQRFLRLPRRRSALQRALAGAAIAVSLGGVAQAQDPDVVIESGSQATLSTSGTYSTLTVTGTGPGGEPSTFTVNAPLTLSNSTAYTVISVSEGGVLNINANVSSSDPYQWQMADVYSGGSLSLTSGTLAMRRLSLSGSSAFSRTGGSYAVQSLYLSDGVSATYTTADSIAAGYYSSAYLDIYSGASLSLARDLTNVNVWLSGSASTLIRNGHALTGGAIYLEDGASLALGESDTFTSLSVLGGSAVTLPSVEALPVVDVEDLRIGGVITGLESRPFTTQNLVVSGGQSVVLRSGAITDTVSNSIGVADATLTLGHDVTLANELSLSGSAATLDRNGHTISAAYLSITSGADFVLDEASDVTHGLQVSSWEEGASTLTLNRNLILGGTTGEKWLRVFGSGATIARASGVTITATGAEVTVAEGAAFTIAAGDDFSGGNLVARDGGMLANAVAASVAGVELGAWYYGGGQGGTYTANALLAVSGTIAVGTNSVFNANAQVTADTVAVAAGSGETSQLNLLSGGLSATTLSVSGSGSAVTRAAGFYSVDALALAEGASIAFTSLDRITDLSLTDAVLTAQAPLELGTLSIAGESLLSLLAFTGDGPGDIEWGLMILGDQAATLDSLILAGRITGTDELDTVYDESTNATYVTLVPEPTALLLATLGLAACGWIRAKRRHTPGHRS